MTRLSAEHVSVEIDGHAIVRNVEARLDSGALIGLIGPNGAGKSTFVRALAQILPLASGRVLIDGTPVTGLPRRERARRIAYLPQGNEVHWPLDVYHLVGLGRLPHLSPLSRITRADEAAIEKAFADADIGDLRSRCVTTLSGGERARVMLARALAVGAPALLADEPVAALDPYHQLQVMELLQARARSGDLVLVVLHDLPLAARFCDRLILMTGGEVIADGAPEAVLDDANLRRAYQVSGLRGQDGAESYVLPWRRLGDGTSDRAPER